MTSRDNILINRTFYQIGVITLIVSIVWIVSGVYRATTRQPSINVDKAILEPLNPVIDQEIIDSLTTRSKIEASIVEENVVEENDELTN